MISEKASAMGKEVSLFISPSNVECIQEHNGNPGTSVEKIDNTSLSTSPSSIMLEQFNHTESTEEVTNKAEFTSWVCPASEKSLRTNNPIRAIVDPIVASSVKCGKERGDGKDQISLALGDPTAYGNFPPCQAIVNAITCALQSPSLAAGYANACGTPEARSAIAKFHSLTIDSYSDDDDVIVANGCSGALELTLTALLDEGSVIMVPKPGFPLYQVIAESHGAKVAHYNLLPDRGWECDLKHMEEVIINIEGKNVHNKMEMDTKNKRKVRGILINNPSNPTGAVYSKNHLREIVVLAERYQLPLVADEIYGDLTYGDAVFHPISRISHQMSSHVPIITCSGLGKQFLIPGWRLGWIVFHDNKYKSLREVKAGAKRLAQVVLGASHLAQCAIPAVLDPPSDSHRISIEKWKSDLKAFLESQALYTFEKIHSCPGLSVISPQGALYAMVHIDISAFDDGIKDDIMFTKLLLKEENVFCLPGQAFGIGANGFHVFRVVFCAPRDQLTLAFERLYNFCVRHLSQNSVETSIPLYSVA